MKRRWSLLIATVAVLAAMALAAVFLVRWPDANHDSAEKVVRQAGVSVQVTVAVQP